MLVYDGTYMLNRKEDPGASPVHACSWQVKVIDLTSSDPNHAHIRPHAVLAFRKEGGIYKASCAETLGKRVCSDFDLKVEDLLWVEDFPDLPGDLYVAAFAPRYHESDLTYTVSWRPILENERNAVAPWS